jgi:hypothetical protein
MLDQLLTLKNYRTVSRNITLGSYSIKTTDYKATGRIDDITYRKDKELWEFLPRCFATIEYNKQVVRTICGLRKFGSEGEYKSAKKQTEELHKEYYLNKANGEYFSFSTFQIDSQIFFIFRSKNVSMVIRKGFYDADITHYATDMRYMFTREMATTFMNIFNNLTPDNQNEIVLKAATNTLSMEYCSSDHQHLVDYGEGAKLLAFSLTNYEKSHNGLTSVLPDAAYNWFKSVGLPTVPYIHIVNMANKMERDTVRTVVYNEMNSEGSVVYQTVIDSVTGVERVWTVYKYKNYKYVFWRAVREKMRVRATSTQLISRLKNLYCPVPNLDELVDQALHFYAFCWFTVKEDDWNNLFSTWVTHFNTFLTLDADQKSVYMQQFKQIDISRRQLQIMSIGLPGTGKSTLLKVMERMLPFAQRLNQDECQKSAKIYHRNLGKLSKDKRIKTLLMDKCYHNRKVREGTFNAIDVQSLVYLVYYHPADLQGSLEDTFNLDKLPLTNAIKLATQRVASRGAGHLNLYPSLELAKILDGFKDSYETLTEQEMQFATSTIYVDMTMNITDTFNYVTNQLAILGFIDLDSLTDDVVRKTIQLVLAEEQKLSRQKSDTLKFDGWFIQLSDGEIDKLYSTQIMQPFGQFTANGNLFCKICSGDNDKLSKLLRSSEHKSVDMLGYRLSCTKSQVMLDLTPQINHEGQPHIILGRTDRTDNKNVVLSDPVVLKGRVIKFYK